MMPDADDHKAARSRYWFPAKRYGWGWGLPGRWQGWLVLIAFLVLMVVGAILFPPPRHAPAFVLWTLACVAALLAVSWLKGEPPRWRWGKDGGR